MTSERSRPSRRMMMFVAAILVIAGVIAVFFMLSTHPGEPEGQPAPHALDQSQ